MDAWISKKEVMDILFAYLRGKIDKADLVKRIDDLERKMIIVENNYVSLCESCLLTMQVCGATTDDVLFGSDNDICSCSRYVAK